MSPPWFPSSNPVILFNPALGKVLGIFVKWVVEDVKHDPLCHDSSPAVGRVFGVSTTVPGVFATYESVLEDNVDTVVIFLSIAIFKKIYFMLRR